MPPRRPPLKSRAADAGADFNSAGSCDKSQSPYRRLRLANTIYSAAEIPEAPNSMVMTTI